MTALLLAAFLNVSDAPLVPAEGIRPNNLDLSESLREPEDSPAVQHLLGWGYSTSVIGITALALAGVMFGMLIAGSNACRASAGCIDESGLAYMYAAIPLIAGFVNASAGFSLVGVALYKRRH